MICPDCHHENIDGEETCQACSAPLSPMALPRPKGGVQSRILEGTITELKPHKAVSLPEESTVADAVTSMRRARMGCVLVTRGGELCGIFTERDFLFEVAGLKDPAATRLADVMHPDPVTLQATDAIAMAFHSMAVRGFRHVPVRLADKGLGVVSSRDLLRYLCTGP